MARNVLSFSLVVFCSGSLACSSSDEGAPDRGIDSGGAENTGGDQSTFQGGAASGGATSSGGSSSTGGVASTGGAATTGGAGTGGEPTLSPEECNPIFLDVCSPSIVFQNEEAAGDGAMFDQVIPDPEGTMKQVACQVCSILYRDPDEVQKKPSQITLTIKDFDGVAYAGGGNITFSSRHIKNYEGNAESALFEYLGVLYHETTHLYQWDNGGGGLVEGMADFVRIRAGHHQLNRRSPGGAWTDAYTTSGFFFSWLAGPGLAHQDGRVPADPDIGWAINQQMKDSWTTQVFVDRLGTDVDTLWAEYQAAIQ